MCIQNCGMTKKEFEEAEITYKNMIANRIAGIHGLPGTPVYEKFERLQEKIVRYKTNHKTKLT